jgi:indolepyruvate ferredoxin oxidoreductase beta subunit
LRAKDLRVISVPASQIARDLGDGRMANVVMLGILSTFLPIEAEIWDNTLRLRIPRKYLDGNLKAFAEGYSLAKGMNEQNRLD